jgi:RNA polymerase sigma factor (sigma-70 family)
MEEAPNEATKAMDRSERGRQNNEEGYSFEDKVAELYRLLHFQVEHGRLFGGRQVDLFLTGHFGDMTIHRAIECKAGQVKAEHMDSFIAKLRMVRREYPSAIGTIVSAVSFTDAIAAQAVQEGIQLTLHRDLAARLFDGHAYAQALIREIESNEQYPKSKYIEPMIGHDAVGESSPAFEILDEWLLDGEWNQLTLLGDVGTGKSFLSRMLAHRLATRFLEQPLAAPFPVRIDLRNADREFSLEGLVITHLAQNGLGQVSFDVFQYSLAQGNIVLILDGFDEMAARVTPQVTSRNFLELARCVRGRAKVLLTCRTHYFKSRTEEEEVILGGTKDYGSETARDLYWELIARKGFKIAYLRPFDTSQIEQYVRRAKPFDADQAMQKIRGTYNLMELSQRPMLLEMIVKSIDKLTAPEINAATLYDVYTSAWVYRDKWRDVLTPEEKLSFLTALSRSLWDEDISGIHYTRLLDYVQENLASQIQDPQRLIEIDSEVRTASFLTRDPLGNYGFAHKSHGEFFFARYIAAQLNSGSVDCLRTRRLTAEIIHFLNYMTDRRNVEPLLETVLRGSYTPLVSENALVCLYGFRRADALDEHSADGGQPLDEFTVSLPSKVDLKGAKLSQVSLEGAMLPDANFSGANLSEGIFRRAYLTGANFSDANLTKSQMVNARLWSVSARSATMVRANFEGADFRGADMTGADLSDAFLLRTRYEDAVLKDIIWNGAVLPEELSARVDRVAGALLKQRLTDSDSPTSNQLTDSDSLTLNQYWLLIEQLRPFMLRVARLTSLMIHVDAEDLVQDTILSLYAPQHIERLTKADSQVQQDYVYSVMRRMLLSQEARAKKESAYAAGLEPEDEWIADDEEFVEDEEEAESAELENIQSEESDELDIYSYPIPLVSAEEVAGPDAAGGVSEVDFDSFQALAQADKQLDENIFSLEMREVLSDRVWRIVNANFIKGYTIREIAEQEEMRPVSVKNILDTARNVLRKHFADRVTSD